MATRQKFSEDAPAGPANDVPKTMVYRCAAHRCRMPGTIYLGGPDGQCWLHARAKPSDWPRITQVLVDWDMVVEEALLARRTMIGVWANDPKKQNELMAEAWNRIRGALPLWETELAPFGGDFGQWGRKLEAFLAGRVHEVVQGARA
jgi:hypothetical protein